MKNNRSIEGTGLGLAITYLLLSNLNGKIEVESTYSKGSLFRVYLPQKIVSHEKTGEFTLTDVEYKENTYKESFQAPEARILVVDDNEMNLFVITSLLKKTQIQIQTCLSGEECLKLTQTQYYDMILIDH